MNFGTGHSDVLTCKSSCVVIPVFEGSKAGNTAASFDSKSGGLLKNLVKSGDFKGKTAQTQMLYKPAGVAAERVLLVGFGKQAKSGISPATFRKAVTAAASALNGSGAKDAHLFFDDVTVDGGDQSWLAEQTVLLFSHRAYKYQTTKSEKKPAPALKKITINAEKKNHKAVNKALAAVDATAQGVAFTRELGNLPGNICTPSYLAEQAKALAKATAKLKITILDEKKMASLGMGSLLSVGHGSDEPSKLIIMNYTGAAKTQKPTVLVGKGITFDTGGISLKPGPAMDEMKFDMCGAASVFGVMKALTVLQPAMNVVAVVAAAENMPSGRATKPGDIVTSMSGKTIEVLNTDAEGRLVLCDALTYAERFKPKAVIDIATLTGACVVALGEHASGLYSNRDELAEKLLAAGQQAHDRAWHMPLWDEYKKQLDSNFADLANIGGPKAGSVTAACFLSHFAEAYPWAHLDIAGTAWLSGGEKGATGRPVPLLMKYLLNNA